MIERPRGKPRRIDPIGYDFEWEERCAKHGGLKPRGKNHHGECAECDPRKGFVFRLTLCGAYDERGYRSYQTVKHFLQGELIRRNAGRFFYAHFGGASDMVFLLQELMRDEGVSIKGVFSGSSAIMVTVQRGELVWCFIDSFWLMQVSLKKIGKWLGPEFAKGEVDYQTASAVEMREYNEQDCKILYTAINTVQDVILEAGGELGVTAAATAMLTFRRRYLKRPIENSPAESDYARPAYVASRVERYRETCSRANYYDINSSFPFSMTQSCPGSVIGTAKNLETGGLWIAECDVSVDSYIPPIPYRSKDNRVFFPNGRFRARITSEDYRCGDFRVEKVWQCRHYEDRDDLAQYAHDFYAKRKASDSEFASQVFKILLNSLYGKFAERDEKQTLHVRPATVPPDWTEYAIAPHVYVVPETVSVPHVHVPISTLITARSRRLLLEHMRKGHSSGQIFYVDTDSVITTAELHTSSELGGLKLEYQIDRGVFAGSKLYAVEKIGGEQQVKAKGFSRVVSGASEKQPLTFEQFIGLTEGKQVHVERMLRIKELLRKEGADYVPRNETMAKALGMTIGGVRVMPRPKRKVIEGNDSRPWNVGELEDE